MKRVSFTLITVWLRFDTKDELEEYKRDNSHKNWKFKESYKSDDTYTLVVEKPYGEFKEVQ